MRKKYEEPEMNTGNGTVNHYNVIAKLYRYGTLKVMVIFLKVVLFSGDLEAKSREKEAQYESRLEALRRDLAEVREQLSSEIEAGRKLTKQMDSLGKELEDLQKKNRDLETEAVRKNEVMSSAATDLDLSSKERAAVVAEKKRVEETAQKLEMKIKELTEATRVEGEVKAKLSQEVEALKENTIALESANRSLTEMRSQLEGDLTAVEVERVELEQQVVSLTEAGQQDKENIRLLKEAKSCLEQDKMRLEADVMEREAKVEEVERTVAEGAKRIADLGIKTHFEV